MSTPQDNNSKTSNSGFYKATSEEDNDDVCEEPKLNNFLSLLQEKKYSKSPKKKKKKSKNEESAKKFGAPVDLKGTQFSIKNDLFFGWKPNVGIKSPFPLFYDDKLIQNIESSPKLIYRGFRPVHSYRLHEHFSGELKYPYNNKSFRLYMNKEIKSLLKMNVKHDMPSSKYNTNDEYSVIFDSFFESGNCDLVLENSPSDYDVFLRLDSNTRGHTHWFYFRMKSPEFRTVTIKIRNMSKGDSIFKRGGCPYYSYDNYKWSQLKRSDYYPTDFKLNGSDPRPSSYRKLHTLEFQVNLRPNIWTYVAYCPPYTFSTLIHFFSNLDLEQKSHIVKRELFCKSESGVESPMLIITEFEKEEPLIARENRPIIVLTGRVHPGETCGSHMIHGMISFLLSFSKKACILRELFEFVMIPMLNTDGVILGNFRTGLAGDDLNRQYLKPEAEFHPSIITLLNKIANLKSNRKVAMYLDLHGHSTKPNVFSYGPELSKGDPLCDFVKIFSKMVDLESLPFKFDKCTWKINKSKKATARAVFLRQLKIKFCYTIEASVGGYEDEDGLFKPFTIDGYRKVGKNILKGFLRFYKLCSKDKSLRNYFYPKSKIDGKIDFKEIEDNLRRELTTSDNMGNFIKDMNEELAHAGPVIEGGSDSESSDDDMPIKKKKKFMEKITKMMRENPINGEKKKKKKKPKKRKRKKKSLTSKINTVTVNKNKNSSKQMISATGKNYKTVNQYYLEDENKASRQSIRQYLNKTDAREKETRQMPNSNSNVGSNQPKISIAKGKFRRKRKNRGTGTKRLNQQGQAIMEERNNGRHSSTNPKQGGNGNYYKDDYKNRYFHSKGAPYSHNYNYNTHHGNSQNVIDSYETIENSHAAKTKFKRQMSPTTSILQRDLREQRDRARNTFKAKIVTTYDNHSRHRKIICGQRVNINSLKRSLKVKRIESDAILRNKAEYLSEKQFIADRNVSARKRIIAEVIKANGGVNFTGGDTSSIVNRILMKFRKKNQKMPKSTRKVVVATKQDLRKLVEDFEMDTMKIADTHVKVNMFIDSGYDNNFPRILGMNKEKNNKLGSKLLPYLYKESNKNKRQSRSVGVNHHKGSPRKHKRGYKEYKEYSQQR